MRYFLDTSALLKRYISEKGSHVVDSLFREEADRYVSSLGMLECFSNLRRLHEVERALTEVQYKTLCASVLSDIESGMITITEAMPTDIASAVSILQKQYMTPIDALQIAIALGLGRDTVFVSSDTKLNRIAEQYRLKVLDPMGQD